MAETPLSMAEKVTMTELARLAKVDISTVSRALSDSPRVKQATKDHVRAIAKKIGYEVDVSARGLRTGSTQTIGVVVPIDPSRGQTISDPFYLEILGAISHAASRRDYDLLLTVPQSDEQVAEARIFRSGKVDGLIVIGQARRGERLNTLAQSTDRVVVWGGRVDEARYTIVGSDNVNGGLSATKHLLSMGRRRILFVGERALPEVELRYQGLLAAHQAYRIEHDEALIVPLAFGALDAHRTLMQVIERGVPFDAIFAASDVLAMAALQVLATKGMRVPDDVPVVGYDNIGQAATTSPPLTTVDQNIALGGEIMVDLLLRKLKGEIVESRLTPTDLIVRQSTLG